MDLLKYFNKNVPKNISKKLYSSKHNRYYFVKGLSTNALLTALEYDVWGTWSSNERAFVKNFEDKYNVILIFISSSSNSLVGYALMKSKPGEYSKSRSKFSDVKFEGPLFDISWVRCVELNPSDYSHLVNDYTRKSIVNSKDGQELDKECGHRLCRLFEKKFKSLIERFTSIPTNPNLPISPHPITDKSPKFLLPNNEIEFFSKVKNTLKHKGANVYSLDMAADFNPSLVIFPIDLSNMSYDTYISLYNTTYNYWLEMPDDVEIPKIS